MAISEGVQKQIDVLTRVLAGQHVSDAAIAVDEAHKATACPAQEPGKGKEGINL